MLGQKVISDKPLATVEHTEIIYIPYVADGKLLAVSTPLLLQTAIYVIK